MIAAMKRREFITLLGDNLNLLHAGFSFFRSPSFGG
jgi:hypothetical protein